MGYVSTFLTYPGLRYCVPIFAALAVPMAHLISRQPFTADTRAELRTNPCQIYGEK